VVSSKRFGAADRPIGSALFADFLQVLRWCVGHQVKLFCYGVEVD
jgi:hypothetical protein